MLYVILPCNKGAALGDYLLSRNWQRVKKILDATTNNYKMVAVDSIITFIDPMHDRDELGALVVYPDEMNRVKGFDVYPSWDFFKKNSFERLYIHSHYVKIGLKRIFNPSDKYLVLLNVRGYRLATYLAIKKLFGRIPKNLAFIDVYDSPAYFNNAVRSIKILLKEDLFGFVIRTQAVKKKWESVGYPEEVPPEFKYWELESILDI